MAPMPMMMYPPMMPMMEMSHPIMSGMGMMYPPMMMMGGGGDRRRRRKR